MILELIVICGLAPYYGFDCLTIQIDNQVEKVCMGHDHLACAFLEDHRIVIPPNASGAIIQHELKHLIMDCNFHGQNFGHKCKPYTFKH